MPPSINSTLIKTLIAKSKRMYKANEIPYEWSDVVKLIDADPEVFAACLRRATNHRYKLPVGTPKSHRLWIACNMSNGYMLRNDCYFCGKVMTRDEFLAGNIHLEHFNPRSGGGAHTPGNITLACSKCNLLKRALCDIDFDLILSNPEVFRATHPSMPESRFQQLMEFAEVAAPRFKGLGWVIERFGVTPQNCRQVWDELRSDYRQKWYAEKKTA